MLNRLKSFFNLFSDQCSAAAGIDLLKLPAILADLAMGWLAWSMTRELGASRWRARLAAVLVVVNPVTWFDSVVWGQVDSFGSEPFVELLLLQFLPAVQECGFEFVPQSVDAGTGFTPLLRRHLAQ